MICVCHGERLGADGAGGVRLDDALANLADIHEAADVRRTRLSFQESGHLANWIGGKRVGDIRRHGRRDQYVPDVQDLAAGVRGRDYEGGRTIL